MTRPGRHSLALLLLLSGAATPPRTPLGALAQETDPEDMMMCADDVCECPGGAYASRNASLGCAFDDCPDTGAPCERDDGGIEDDGGNAGAYPGDDGVGAGPNAASRYCTEEMGGTLEIFRVDDEEGEFPGEERGVCRLPDGTMCEQWSLYNGECGPNDSSGSGESDVDPEEMIMCTDDACECPDGVSYASRNASLGCAFDVCPDTGAPCEREDGGVPPEDPPEERPEDLWVQAAGFCEESGGEAVVEEVDCQEGGQCRQVLTCVLDGGATVCDAVAYYRGGCEPGTTGGGVGMGNPASVHCEEMGGEVDVRKDETGGEYGVCVFPDSSCEEWALLRGECAVCGGGSGSTASLGESTAAEPSPPAVEGESGGGGNAGTGTVGAARNSPAAQCESMQVGADGTSACVFPDGSRCEEGAFFAGECSVCRASAAPPGTGAGLGNPASAHCEERGGKVDVREDEQTGGEYGVCVFDDDGRECDEWAFYRNECSRACGHQDDACMHDGAWNKCFDLETGGCADVQYKESCPLQFSCGGCTKDARACHDGSTVVRDPEDGCRFAPCPKLDVSAACGSPSDACMNEGNWGKCRDLVEEGCQQLAVAESCPAQFFCDDDIEDVEEVVDDGGATSSASSCDGETKECPDGTLVGKDPESDCDFFPCTGEEADGKDATEGQEEAPTETTTEQQEPADTECDDDARECPDGSFVVRDLNNNCEFPDCPEVAPGCSKELRECPDGSSVGRDPDNDCEFPDCPEVAGCSKELKNCPDGSSVGRDPDNNCEFPDCPEEVAGCSEEAKECPDGSSVGRDPNNNCEFFDCPEEGDGGVEARSPAPSARAADMLIVSLGMLLLAFAA